MAFPGCQDQGAQTPTREYWPYAVASGASTKTSIVYYRIEEGKLGQGMPGPLATSHPDIVTDTKKAEDLWDLYVRLVPRYIRKDIVGLDIFTDGIRGTVAQVYQDKPGGRGWNLAIDYADAYRRNGTLDIGGLQETLLHETGHILTLDRRQMLTAAKDCTTYRTGENCSKSSSYINRFYDLYWRPHEDYIRSMEDTGGATQLERLRKDFYENHADEFLGAYAATGVEEDIAETFAYFILAGKPYGSSIADDKVRFLYGFPSLVRLRKIIRSNVAAMASES